ncbi:MFS transporter [Candidatus Bathyarchaeota archaeon]|nr:MFS transporter [Candidatus Bathyarchaeota archaeon]
MDNRVEDYSGRAVLLVVALSSFLTPFAASSFNLALPSMGRELMLDAALLGWLALSYLLASAIFLVPFGKLADMVGRKRVFLYGTLVFTASSLLLAFLTSTFFLLLLRTLQGVGSAMLFGTGPAILVSSSPTGRRGRLLGLNVASVYLGLSLGPSLGGALTQRLGWRSTFLMNAALGLVIIIFTIARMRGEWRGAGGGKFDSLGSLLYGLTLLLLIYGFSSIPSAQSLLFMAFGGLSTLLFLNWELRVKNPVLEVRMFTKNRVFALSNLAALLNYGATSAVAFLMSLYLQYPRGFDPQTSGLILLSQPVMQATFSPLAGTLSDRVEARILASTGMGITTLGLLLLTLLDEATPMEAVVLDLLILGLGFALFSSPNMNAVMSSVEKGSYGIASAILGTMRLIGQMLSMSIATTAIAASTGGGLIEPSTYPLLIQAMRSSFTIFSILCLIGTLASTARGRMR